MVTEVRILRRSDWESLMLTSSWICVPGSSVWFLTDTVVNNDGIVNRITQQSQDNCHKVGVDLKPAQNHAAIGDDQCGEQSQHSAHTCGPAADLLEPERNVHDQDQCSEYCCHDALGEEFARRNVR